MQGAAGAQAFRGLVCAWLLVWRFVFIDVTPGTTLRPFDGVRGAGFHGALWGAYWRGTVHGIEHTGMCCVAEWLQHSSPPCLLGCQVVAGEGWVVV